MHQFNSCLLQNCKNTKIFTVKNLPQLVLVCHSTDNIVSIFNPFHDILSLYTYNVITTSYTNFRLYLLTSCYDCEETYSFISFEVYEFLIIHRDNFLKKFKVIQLLKEFSYEYQTNQQTKLTPRDWRPNQYLG